MRGQTRKGTAVARHCSARLLALSAGAAAALLLATNARADEPRKVTEPSVMQEPGEITNVIDAFDDDDMFDLRITLGYQHSWKSAAIQRETHSSQQQFSSGGYTATNLELAKYEETTSRLNTRIDVGIFKDIALILRLPIILSNDRELKGSGSKANQALGVAGAPGERLFQLPFKAPTRSGIEYFAAGLDFGVLNQYRDVTKPTWVFGFEGRFSVSDPLHACNAAPESGQEDCAYEADVDRDGESGRAENLPDVSDQVASFNGGRKAGVSRGTTALEVHTYLSKRIKYIEPYGGFSTLFEFQNSSSDYGNADLKGNLVNHPPLQGSMIFGLEVVPWELLDKYQRLSFDLRFTGTYRSEGRDYSELYDALGSSDARSLRSPNFAQYQTGPDAETPSVVNPGSQKVYVNGLTDVQQYGTYTFSTGVTWQAGEYIKFNLGGGYTVAQGHVVTFDQACNPDFDSDKRKSGPCLKTDSSDGTPTASGLPNPNYRAVINAPGRRFRVADSAQFDAWVNATVMF